jgi:hypothetical protein
MVILNDSDDSQRTKSKNRMYAMRENVSELIGEGDFMLSKSRIHIIKIF